MRNPIMNQISDLLVYLHMDLESKGDPDPKKTIAEEISKAIQFSDKQAGYIEDTSVGNMSEYLSDMIKILESLRIKSEDEKLRELLRSFLQELSDRYDRYEVQRKEKAGLSVYASVEIINDSRKMMMEILERDPKISDQDLLRELAGNILIYLTKTDSLPLFAESIAETTIDAMSPLPTREEK